MATVMPDPWWRRPQWWLAGALVGVLIAIVLAVILTTVDFETKITAENDGDPFPSASPSQTPAFKPTLETVRERGVLRCGSPDAWYLMNYNDKGERVGMLIYLCKAVAAGIFGNKTKIELVDVQEFERFTTLASNDVDLFFRAVATMGRDGREISSGVGLTFSVPYLYSGVAFGGKEFFVQCADDLNTRDECSGLVVCTAPGTKYTVMLEGILSSGHILRRTIDEIAGAFVEGRCNVIIANVWDLVVVLIKQNTFGTGHSVGQRLLSHKGLTIVTRDDDPEWSDFVNWVLQSLFEAEKLGITQDTADDFKVTSVFGAEYENIFRNAIAAAGNYAEIYQLNLEPTVPRSGMRLINTNHTSGILLAPDLYGVSESGPKPISGGEIERMSQKGYLVCGITDARPRFAEFNSTSGVWSGLDVDFCRAVANSIFLGLASEKLLRFVEYEDVEDGYEALAEGSVDVLCGQRVTLGADVSGYGSGAGAAFSHPYFYGEDGRNRALAVRQSDPQWSSFVYWIVDCTIYAEEQAITQRSPNLMPEVNLFGSRYRRMFRDAILAVGNYGEMYSRNLESLIPRSGLNLLNVEPVGPQIFPLPFDDSVQ